jgi:hypothetical protein
MIGGKSITGMRHLYSMDLRSFYLLTAIPITSLQRLQIVQEEGALSMYIVYTRVRCTSLLLLDEHTFYRWLLPRQTGLEEILTY